MVQLKRLATRSSLYFFSNLLVILAGAISLPLWTRLFSQEQYGLFALFNVTIGFMVVFSKFGMQHAALRFYSEVQGRKLSTDTRTYCSTTVIGGAFLSLVVTTLVVVCCYGLLRGSDSQVFGPLLLVAGAVVLVQSTTSILMNMIRAEQLVRLHSFINVA